MASYNPLIYKTDGGNTQVVASGGVVNIETGGALQMAGVDVTAALTANAVATAKGGNVALLRTATGVSTLIAAAAVARFVVIHVLIVTSFAAGDGAAPIFDFGETDSAEKFKADLTTGSAAAVLTYAGTLTANKALIVTSTAATGATSTGAITVTAIASV